MVSLKAICDALAARYAAGTIATPTGATAMRSSWAQAPHGPKPTPFLVIAPQTGDVIGGAGEWQITHHVDANFYLSKAPGDIHRVETLRQLWLPTLLAAPLGLMTLGITNVKSDFPVSYEFLELPYEGDGYDGITIHLDVIVREPVTFTP